MQCYEYYNTLPKRVIKVIVKNNNYYISSNSLGIKSKKVNNLNDLYEFTLNYKSKYILTFKFETNGGN